MPGQLIKLNLDRPGSRWLIFPTAALRALYVRRAVAHGDYVNTWTDVQGFGLHHSTEAAR